MNALNKIVILAALVCVPNIARADFGRRPHGDHSCSYGGSSPYGYNEGSYNNYGYNNHGYNNYGFGSWGGNGNYNYGNYPRPRDNNYNTGFGLTGYDNAIRNGVRSGQLSPREVEELRGDIREIREKEYESGSDGRLSPRERNDLRDEYNELRKDLNHELNDGERRW